MRRLMLTLILVGPLLAATGCAFAPRSLSSMPLAAQMRSFSPAMPETPLQPPPGFIYEDVKAPLDLNYDKTEADPGKVGRSSSIYIGIPFYRSLSVALKDQASVANSARNGGISEVEYADYHFFNVLGVFERFTVITYGK